MLERLIALPIAALAAFALATTAMAGGWAQVTVVDPPVDPPAGTGTTIEMNVLQHGVAAVSWPHLSVVATNADSGAVVRTEARAEGPKGTYFASIVFPTAGEWTLTFNSPELEMGGSVAMNVMSAAAATTPSDVAVDVSLVLLLLVVVLAASAVTVGLNVRRARDVRVPASN